MKIAITDACIFIDLIDLRLMSEFFGLPLEIHTSLDVYNELFPNQQDLLRAYQSTGKLIIHNLSHEDRIHILQEVFPRSLSENDKSVLFLAIKHNAMVISSDKAVRNFASTIAIEYHGMLWIFDGLIDANLISKEEAIAKINFLISTNPFYKNNMQLISEIKKRIEKWS
jgi:predicted nucleic acid-binding protein